MHIPASAAATRLLLPLLAAAMLATAATAAPTVTTPSSGLSDYTARSKGSYLSHQLGLNTECTYESLYVDIAEGVVTEDASGGGRRTGPKPETTAVSVSWSRGFWCTGEQPVFESYSGHLEDVNPAALGFKAFKVTPTADTIQAQGLISVPVCDLACGKPAPAVDNHDEQPQPLPEPCEPTCGTAVIRLDVNSRCATQPQVDRSTFSTTLPDGTRYRYSSHGRACHSGFDGTVSVSFVPDTPAASGLAAAARPQPIPSTASGDAWEWRAYSYDNQAYTTRTKPTRVRV
eukprot:XP_001697202.1 predicted protein [Chlamydomonas reinhardtii]